MPYPIANWPTVMNIAKSLLAVETFYNQTCDLMKALLLPPPFADPESVPSNRIEPKYIFHTILEFVCSKAAQILENDTLTTLSLEAISELLSYFKEKQLKELKENNKLLHKASKHQLLEKVAELEYTLLTLNELAKENDKRNQYRLGMKRKNNRELSECVKKKFIVEEPKTEYCEIDLSKDEDLYDKFFRVTKEEIREKCLPLEQIPSGLLAKCKNEPPSASLFLFNLPKSVQSDEVLELVGCILGGREEVIGLDILKGRFKGQGFLHLSNEELAGKVREALFGFPLQGKPMILQFSRAKTQINC